MLSKSSGRVEIDGETDPPRTVYTKIRNEMLSYGPKYTNTLHQHNSSVCKLLGSETSGGPGYCVLAMVVRFDVYVLGEYGDPVYCILVCIFDDGCL